MSEYIPIRRNGRLLFKFDPARLLIQVKRGKEVHTIDLEAEVADVAERPGAMTTAEAMETIKRIART
jgi:hypothetical protein